MRKKNQQSLPEPLNKYPEKNELIIDPQIQKSELVFSPENMFFPVLGIKKNVNIYQKKMVKIKQNFLNLNHKKDLYKSQHFNNNFDNSSDEEIANNEYLKKQVIFHILS